MLWDLGISTACCAWKHRVSGSTSVEPNSVRAAARSLRAYRGGIRAASDSVDVPALTQDGPVDVPYVIPVFVQIGWRRHEDLEGGAFPSDVPVQLLRCLTTMGPLGHDHEEVHVAVRPGVAPGTGAEQDDPQGMHSLHDAANDAVDRLLCRVHFRNVPHRPRR
jgi:hypothetical protein